MENKLATSLLAKWTINIQTVSESNVSEHWTKKSARHRQQQEFVRKKFEREQQKIDLPCEIKLVRLSPCLLDDDNLVTAFKWIRDQVADCILPGLKKGRADADKRLSWKYDQEKHPIAAVRIEISS